jgi:hypothetical protein
VSVGFNCADVLALSIVFHSTVSCLGEFSNDYFALITDLHKKVREKKNQAVTQPVVAQSSAATARKPKIELVTFNGSSDKFR